VHHGFRCACCCGHTIIAVIRSGKSLTKTVHDLLMAGFCDVRTVIFVLFYRFASLLLS